MDEAFAVYEPWQPGTSNDIRKDYAEAVALQETDPSEAARRMAKVAERSPGDPVIKNWMERLGAKPVS
jgi:hypothetical protein